MELPNMELLSQEQRLEVRDLCRIIVRRSAEQSADKVLQQLKSEYCCPQGRAPLPDVWTPHNIEIKTKRLDSNNYNCFYCTSNNTTIHNTLDPVRSLSKQPNTVQQYNKEKTGLGPARQSAPLQALTRLSILLDIGGWGEVRKQDEAEEARHTIASTEPRQK